MMPLRLGTFHAEQRLWHRHKPGRRDISAACRAFSVMSGVNTRDGGNNRGYLTRYHRILAGERFIIGGFCRLLLRIRIHRRGHFRFDADGALFKFGEPLLQRNFDRRSISHTATSLIITAT